MMTSITATEARKRLYNLLDSIVKGVKMSIEKCEKELDW